MNETALMQEMIKCSKINEDDEENEAVIEEVSEENEARSSGNSSSIGNICDRNVRAIRNDEKNDDFSSFMPK